LQLPAKDQVPRIVVMWMEGSEGRHGSRCRQRRPERRRGPWPWLHRGRRRQRRCL